MLDDEIDSQKPLPWNYPGEDTPHRRHTEAKGQMTRYSGPPYNGGLDPNEPIPAGAWNRRKMKVKLAQELWVVEGELTVPWIKMMDGTGARGIAFPTPVVLEKGVEVEIQEIS